MPIDSAAVRRYADLVLSCLDREYPNKIAHVLEDDGDARPPRALTPAFFGAFDWHSAVHGHFTLVRLLRARPDLADELADARAALHRSLTAANIAGEVAYLERACRRGFEMPYGIAWLLRLAAELRQWPEGADLAADLAALEALAAERFADWLRRLPGPVRTGEHGQSAFAMGLVLDYARLRGDAALAALLARRADDFYGADLDAPLGYEPSAFDFLSPVLAEADLMRRVLEPDRFAAWLAGFAPALGARDDVLTPVDSGDPSDGKLAHRDGLNLSRAWMLAGIACALPEDSPRRPGLRALAERHARAGLAAVRPEHYAGAHWLGTFAVYWLTRELS